MTSGQCALAPWPEQTNVTSAAAVGKPRKPVPHAYPDHLPAPTAVDRCWLGSQGGGPSARCCDRGGRRSSGGGLGADARGHGGWGRRHSSWSTGRSAGMLGGGQGFRRRTTARSPAGVTLTRPPGGAPQGVGAEPTPAAVHQSCEGAPAGWCRQARHCRSKSAIARQTASRSSSVAALCVKGSITLASVYGHSGQFGSALMRRPPGGGLGKSVILTQNAGREKCH